MVDSGAVRRYRGDFVAWSGGCGFIGEGGGGPIAPHSHYAIQLVIGAPSGLRVQFGRNGPWQPCAAALVPSRATHSIDVSECAFSAVLFVEPETTEGKALTSRLHGQMEMFEADRLSPASSCIESAWRGESYEAVQAACHRLVLEVSGTSLREPSDPRVLAAIEFIRERVTGSVSLAEVAEAARLSPGRFRHLFVEQTGMPLRTYILWRRLLHVWTLLMQGATLSTAAHGAGFADSAHLSRTARTMFGLPPSALSMSGPLSERTRMRKA